MLEFIICLVLHCLISFVLNYCYDTEKIWNNGGTSPNLHMPKLQDLDEKCDIYKQQKYVDEVIIPANNYFSMVSYINEIQNHEFLVQLMARSSTFLFVVNAFHKSQITPYILLNIIIGSLVYVVLNFFVSIIYNRTKLKLGTFELSIDDLKKEFHYIKEKYGWEFEISEENMLNNFIIEKHYNYLRYVENTIEKRYKVKKVVEAITGFLYILFIWQVPK